MDYFLYFYVIFQIFFAFLLGGFIGYEREKHGIGAGIRTYAAVSMGAAIFTIVGNNLMDMQGASRMVSNVITGVGFLGAGIIFKDAQQQRATGLTTASTIWATSAVGVAVGYKLYPIAVFSALALYFLLALDDYKWYKNWRDRLKRKMEEEQQS